MGSQALKSLGILNLERGLPPGEKPSEPRPGSLMNPATYDFAVISETVAGAWADVVIKGDPALEPACIAAAKRLVERGAVAISSNCGFFMRHQAAVAAAVNVPVVLSSLIILPALLRQIPATGKLAVVTADSTKVSDELLGIDKAKDRSRIVVGGIEGGKLLQNEMMRPPPPTDVADIEKDVVACVARLQEAHPKIAAILFECTAFPLVTPTIRRSTGLPIYDITDLCRLTLASLASV
ncbi:hypothetical protein [Mesorhizobium sp. B4-1-4]|uniref:hypothetical protein n=1 Tax=Mesorhizobium sp. B4-1-4 TaxID=2589888 RepID=UPI0015E2BDD1|nr:hypothetical protein [Mesorhizobium sp. B4-1-4]UCI31798.1 hypothetical protein FJW03_29270 [Mesorhizobium sp. B4-1-4]